MQKEVYTYICCFVQKFGAAPTIRQIGQKFGWYGTAKASEALKALEAAGLIQRSAIQLSATRVVGDDDTSWRLMSNEEPSTDRDGYIQFVHKRSGTMICVFFDRDNGTWRDAGHLDGHFSLDWFRTQKFTHWRYMPRLDHLP